MSKIDFIKNKYSISVLILLVCMGADILLHRGMSRVMLPSAFTEKIKPFNLDPVFNPVSITGKSWLKEVNTAERLQNLDPATPGFECDVYFDTTLHQYFVYHDSTKISGQRLDSLLSIYQQRDLKSSIWFDLKNLSNLNCNRAVAEMNRLHSIYDLSGKTIIESPEATCLQQFFNQHYFTSYYIPFFNPYKMEETQLVESLESIAATLKKYPTCAISGYYFQYPVLKKFFPNYPILTWSDRSRTSVVSLAFNRQLQQDSLVKVVLYNK